jgi:transcription elongation factor Elf1
MIITISRFREKLQVVISGNKNRTILNSFRSQVKSMFSSCFRCCPSCGSEAMLYVPTEYYIQIDDVKLNSGDLICTDCGVIFRAGSILNFKEIDKESD